MRVKTLNGVFDVYGDNIFAGIHSIELEDAEIASLLYFDHSAGKIMNPFFGRMIDDKGKEYTIAKIGSMFDAKYGQNVRNLVYAFEQEYNPIHNVDEDTVEETDGEGTRIDNLADTRTPNITEVTDREPNITRTRTPDLVEESNRTPNIMKTRTPNLRDTEERTPDLTEESVVEGGTVRAKTMVYAYNANGTPTPASEAENVENRVQTDKHTGTETTSIEHSGSETETETGNDTETRTSTGTETEKETGEDKTKVNTTGTDEIKHTGTQNTTSSNVLHRRRKGNIGVTTTQQLLTAEVEFREKYTLFEIICGFLDELITIPYYVNC